MGTTVVVTTGGALLAYGPSGNAQVLSTTVRSVSTVVDRFGVTAIYAIVTGGAGAQYNNTLWENYNGAWSERSSGQFKQISATTDSGGNAVVFGVLTDGSLWEEPVAFGLDTGWVELSGPGTIQSISAVTDNAGNKWCYAIVTADDSLWLHGPADVAAAWQEISNGRFTQVSAGLNSAGHAVAYGVVADESLWEYNPDAGGWRNVAQSGAVLSVAAGGPDTAFAVLAQGGVAEYKPTSATLVTPAIATQLSATQTPAGSDEVFMTLADSSFWEFSSAAGGSFTDLLMSGAAASSTPE